MHLQSSWLDFLNSQGAESVDGLVQSFSLNEPVNADEGDLLTVMTDLTHLGIIKVEGEDAQSFLQNQTCNNVHELSDSTSQLSAICSAKGRVISLFRVVQHNTDYYLLLPQERLEPTLKRLQMYVLMSKVSLKDVSAESAMLSLSGPQAEKRLNKYFDPLPSEINACRHCDDQTVVKVAGQGNRYLVFGTIPALVKIWTDLSPEVNIDTHTSWQLKDIRAGIPEVVNATTEEFVPQMINLHAIGGVSFNKGCYPGQEVVARMHFLGKLKRRMYLATVQGSESAKPGDSIHSDQGQSVGKVVSAQCDSQQNCHLLVVLQISSANEEQLHLDGHANATLSLKELPYSVELERETPHN